MTTQELQNIFQNRFNASAWQELLKDVLGARDLREKPEKLDASNNTETGYYLGKLTVSETQQAEIGLFYYQVKKGSVVTKRVGLRNLVRGFVNKKWGMFSAALCVFDDSENWRLSLVCDLENNATSPKRFTFLLGKDKPCRTVVGRFLDLQKKEISLENLRDAFSISELNKEFFSRLVQWYDLACNDFKLDFSKAEKILGKNVDNQLKPEAIIRIIIRMMFLWFMKEKGLVPKDIFDEEWAKTMLTGKQDTQYYNAILQNLFFAVLNKKIKERRFRKQDKNNRYNPETNDYGVADVMRFENYFNKGKSKDFIEFCSSIPFVNGGLFQCHDNVFSGKKNDQSKYHKDDNFLIDGFSESKPARISDSAIFQLIELLGDYAFTIEESTPHEQDIALDPELLGTVFENLIGYYNPETKESARKTTGSFYTPREIVDYMCKESLKETLITKFPKLKNDIQNLVENDEETLNFPQKTKIISAITSIKVLDPACGSGAFPMGMFNLMVRTIEKLQEHKTTYKNKLDIITNCIYGVDIQNIAVEISKLRFFISLLVDYETPRKIEDFDVLPNLETKFVVANTLIGLDKTSQQTLFDAHTEFEQLTEIFLPYTTAKTPAEKTKIKNAFERKKNEILLDDKFGSDADKIDAWNPFNVCYASPFFDKQIMFGLADGFDIVIGNPPYVQLQKNRGELSNLYGPRIIKEGNKKKIIPSQYKTFDSMGDLYLLFYERGWQMLKPQGRLCFITSNKWMRAGYGEKIREFFVKNTNPELLVDFAGVKVFESATVDTNILMFSKDKNRQICKACLVKKEGIKDLSDFIRQHNTICNFSAENWVVLSPVEQRIKQKIETVGTPL
ncbi:MAG: Eco57I restriction-modification methylase domain-containing protein, partial [Bacteroidales bacterium]|nr:Eco57I restriction-modification methylase domain-containing protein [Bacteroidales bacterium]